MIVIVGKRRSVVQRLYLHVHHVLMQIVHHLLLVLRVDVNLPLTVILSTQRDPIIVPNGAPLEAITFNLGFGDEVIEVLASCDRTDGANDILRITLPPNSIAPQHRHMNNDEWFYVLEGQVNMLVCDQIIPAGPW